MATRSTIWIETTPGVFTGAYNHFDGYLSEVGRMLFLYYYRQEKIEELIELGGTKSIYPVPSHREQLGDINVYRNVCVKELEGFEEEFNYFFMLDKEWYYVHDQITFDKKKNLGKRLLNDNKITDDEYHTIKAERFKMLKDLKNTQVSKVITLNVKTIKL